MVIIIRILISYHRCMSMLVRTLVHTLQSIVSISLHSMWLIILTPILFQGHGSLQVLPVTYNVHTGVCHSSPAGLLGAETAHGVGAV